ncbi:hypothetical protein G6F66_001702 [Rhizopus arrhizus]|nr:hypothetical protein G6F38_003324 [Rhizopus arrhizus]KAG1162696.1 hypothetical protein G6F37_001923 [Rhizopus arrhizus]KAG1298456.1 hypothetical protein G6F66_001702 [Rhizopus arrhizus]
MLFTGRLVINTVRRAITPKRAVNLQRNVSTLPLVSNTRPVQLFNYNIKETPSVASISEYVSHLRPFSAPSVPQPLSTPLTQVQEQFELTSVLRKRRLKMNKHKHKKLRKRTRALRKRLGK